MLITKIINENYKLLEDFIKKEHPTQFRYYISRGIEVVKSHILTIIGVDKDNSIAYGHIDYDRGINWIGLCILDKYQGKGYGKQILSYLLDYIKINNIDNVKLSVDIDNYKALNLYLKYDFKISEITTDYYILNYNPSIQLPVSVGEALIK